MYCESNPTHGQEPIIVGSWMHYWKLYKLAKRIGDVESAAEYRAKMEPWNKGVQPDVFSDHYTLSLSSS